MAGSRSWGAASGVLGLGAEGGQGRGWVVRMEEPNVHVRKVPRRPREALRDGVLGQAEAGVESG